MPLTDPFSAAASDLMQSALAVDATYVPYGGQPVDIRIVPLAEDRQTEFGATTFVSATFRCLIAVSAIAKPTSGDLITYGGRTYQVQGVPMRDQRHLFWHIEAPCNAND
ncbi:head-tail joining protein [Mesobacterium pallidum]|uniref:head-tail joining protein n=1 Tax=Mesobacterium pallidum TaxID=2872037 RepID=UPI001EE3780D|nr:head-tail adaptor protein [Mesobacterium pallidum]